MIGLACPTRSEWLQVVLEDFDAFLLDHAACERKASATAMHLVSHYRDRKVLVDAMVDLAREELEHFAQVYKWIVERGLMLGADTKDSYVRQMNACARKGSDVYLMDRLLIAGIIEARGCERFGLVAGGLQPGALREFYVELTRAEARHQALFPRLARHYFERAPLERRSAELVEQEAEIVSALPLRPAVH